jgi:hypothetical protein
VLNRNHAEPAAAQIQCSDRAEALRLAEVMPTKSQLTAGEADSQWERRK